MENLNKLSTAEKFISGGALLMFIASFLDWWSVSVEGIASFGEDGWGDPAAIWSVLAILLSIALAAVVIATRLGNVDMPTLPDYLTWGRVLTGGAAAVVVLILLKGWRISAADAGGFDVGYFLALVATAAIAYGGYLVYSEEKDSIKA